MVAAFRTPQLYSKLLERFAGHPVPQKEGLRNLLFREFGIVESMAAYAAEAFLDSLKDAGLINANNSISVNGASAPAAANGAGADKPTIEKPAVDQQPSPGMQLLKVPQDFVIYKCKISGGRIIEIPLPPKFATSDVNRLHAFLCWVGAWSGLACHPNRSTPRPVTGEASHALVVELADAAVFKTDSREKHCGFESRRAHSQQNMAEIPAATSPKACSRRFRRTSGTPPPSETAPSARRPPARPPVAPP
jgi:hypothetical protein